MQTSAWFEGRLSSYLHARLLACIVPVNMHARVRSNGHQNRAQLSADSMYACVRAYAQGHFSSGDAVDLSGKYVLQNIKNTF